jgi:hypothetical protein
MDRSKRARIYSLVLDPSDKVAAVLIAAIDVYLAIKAAEMPKTPDEEYGATCPYCNFQSIGQTERSARMGLKAHIRQIHPREWIAGWKK